MKSIFTKVGIILGVLSAIFIITITINLDNIKLWAEGLSYFYNNEDYLYRSVILDKEYFIDINLENLNENIGKVLYDDEKSKIVISEIKNNDGIYEAIFRSYGSYSINEGVLVSGIKHTATSTGGYFSDLIAKAYSKYNGTDYNADVASSSGMIYKDGDEFSYYIFPYDYILKEGIYNVTIKIENLCKNEWIKK